jgi:metal-dependent HD superfamily phosphatase/phosphodiesterase
MTKTADTAKNPITLDDVRRNPEVAVFVHKADHNLEVLGYTEHAERHAGIVATTARDILLDLHRPARTAELAAIAGYLHDVGNAISRLDHGIAAALMARDLLRHMGMPVEEYAEVMAAVGNHEEQYGEAISDIAAALILGDKSDVNRDRVRNPDPHTFDIHDRVNLASQNAAVKVDAAARTISLSLDIDTTVSQVMEYFEIFLSRMLMCRRAAAFLGCDFTLVINGTRLL